MALIQSKCLQIGILATTLQLLASCSKMEGYGVNNKIHKNVIPPSIVGYNWQHSFIVDVPETEP